MLQAVLFSAATGVAIFLTQYASTNDALPLLREDTSLRLTESGCALYKIKALGMLQAARSML